jgi:hypothetical protein
MLAALSRRAALRRTYTCSCWRAFFISACFFLASSNISKVSSFLNSYSIVFEPELLHGASRLSLNDVDLSGSTREFRPGKLLLRRNRAISGARHFGDRDDACSETDIIPGSTELVNVCSVLGPHFRPEDHGLFPHNTPTDLHELQQVLGFGFWVLCFGFWVLGCRVWQGVGFKGLGGFGGTFKALAYHCLIATSHCIIVMSQCASAGSR